MEEGGPKISVAEVVLISLPLIGIYLICAVLELLVITEPLSILIGEGVAFLLMLYYRYKKVNSMMMWINGLVDLLLQQIPLLSFIPMELLAFWVTAYILSKPGNLAKVEALTKKSPAKMVGAGGQVPTPAV